jgi:deoxyribonuclease (pyrimidine dimer)
MTRINIIPPEELMDQHLIAEYRETRLLTSNLRRSFASNSKSKIPSKFTLNAGHILFFKNKGLYINNRYKQLQAEMRKRGFEPQFPDIDTTVWPPSHYNDWTPTELDMNIVRERIALRISQRPGWYRYYGKVV